MEYYHLRVNHVHTKLLHWSWRLKSQASLLYGQRLVQIDNKEEYQSYASLEVSGGFPDEIFVQLRMNIEISLCETEVMSGQFLHKNGSIQQKDIRLIHCFQILFVYVFTYISISRSKIIFCFIFISSTSQIALHFCQLHPCIVLCNRRSLEASMYTHTHLMYWQLPSKCTCNFQMIFTNQLSDLNKNRSY